MISPIIVVLTFIFLPNPFSLEITVPGLTFIHSDKYNAQQMALVPIQVRPW
jgi:hypothetical protein